MHKINHYKLLQTIEENFPMSHQIIKKLYEKEKECFLIGGIVRDVMIFGNCKLEYLDDFDFEIYKIELDEFLNYLDLKKIKYSENKGVIKLLEETTSFSIPRIESFNCKNELNITLDPFLDPKTACLRRDLTINAIMYDMQTGKLFDFNNGLIDLKKKKLKHITENFTKDPLRLLRLIRFGNKLNFDISKKTLTLATQMISELPKLNSHYINKEFQKILSSGNFENALNLIETILTLEKQDNVLSRNERIIQSKLEIKIEKNASNQKNLISKIRQKINGYNVYTQVERNFFDTSEKGKFEDSKTILMKFLFLEYLYNIWKWRNIYLNEEVLEKQIFLNYIQKSSNKKEKTIINKLIELNGKGATEFLNMSDNKIWDYLIFFENKSSILINFLILNEEKNLNIIEKKEMQKILKRHKYLFQKFQILLKKYNGKYFLKKGIKPLEIKTQQIKKIIPEIKKMEWQL